jgi:hypothetical protein
MRKIEIKAVALGCLADWAGTMAFGLVFGMIAIGFETTKGMGAEQAVEFLRQWSLTRTGTLFSMLFGLGFTCLGGYVAARTARQETLWNSAIVGCIAVLTGAPFMSNAPLLSGALLSLVLSLPAAVAGGFLYTRKINF